MSGELVSYHFVNIQTGNVIAIFSLPKDTPNIDNVLKQKQIELARDKKMLFSEIYFEKRR